MTAAENLLLARIRQGLDWPAFESWSDRVDPQDLLESVESGRSPAEVRALHAPCRKIDDGGPWVELFDDLAGVADGPLAGQTFAVKALMAVKGRVTTAGSPVRADAPAERASAPFLQQLRALGATPLGTVTMHEFAFGVTGVNPWAGTAPNPAAPGRVPGGSSSGSASAVADGSASFAIGTDTGGSVRIPSAFCGIAGFKPAHGTYRADGVFPLSVTLDHVGLHARSVAEVTAIHAALGHRVDPAPDPGSLRIGVARADLDAASDEVRHRVEDSLDRLAAAGATLVDIPLPDARAAFVASTGIMFSEAAAIHGLALAEHRDRYGDDIRTRLELGAELTGVEVAAAHRLRGDLIAQVTGTLSGETGVDAIVWPTVPIVAPPIADAADPTLAAQVVANTRLANVVALPALSIPAPTDGLPVGVQVLGLTNSRTLAVGATVEQVIER